MSTEVATAEMTSLVVVKHTFLHLVNEVDGEEVERARPRAHSDSVLFEAFADDNCMDELKECRKATIGSDVDTDVESNRCSSESESINTSDFDDVSSPVSGSGAVTPVAETSPCANGMAYWPMQMGYLGEDGVFYMPANCFMMPVEQNPAPQPGGQVGKKNSKVSKENRKQKVEPTKPVVASGKMPEPPATADGVVPTTVMLRNVPNNISRDALLSLLDQQGFEGQYDFVYLPIDFARQANLGYAFINLLPGVTERFWNVFQGFSSWGGPSRKVCEVIWSSPCQGIEEHIARYRNSPLMHEAVPDQCRPVLFENGKRIAFPPPTKSVRAPRFRMPYVKRPFWQKDGAGKKSV
jgi:hypothetical protein